MLSVELAKRKSESHLQSLIEHLNSPFTLEELSQEKRNLFKQAVLERIEQRREWEIANGSDGTIFQPRYSHSEDGDCSFTGCCKGGKRGEMGEPQVVWRRLECKTPERFETFLSASILTNLNCIRCLRAITQSFSFWEEPHPEWNGLSVIGCYMWITSFAIQHILDEDKPKDAGDIETASKGIKEDYQEIAQSGEMFIDMAEKFKGHTSRLRSDGVSTVKRIVRKWKIEEESPLLKRPEKHSDPHEAPRRRIGKGLGEIEGDNLFEDTPFHLHWTPLTIVLRSKNMSLEWQDFGMMDLGEKFHWVAVFLHRALDIVQIEADNMHVVEGLLESIQLGDGLKAHARELSSSILSCSKALKVPKAPSSSEQSKMIRLISQYWYSVDILHEESVKLLRLIRETRDIIRTCYVYTDTLYRWELPSYDSYLLRDSRGQGGKKGKRKMDTIETIKEGMGKYVATDGGKSERKLSDIGPMLVMMDFSTSAYQKILEVIPVEAEDMQMKLWDEGPGESGLGLISGNDTRKK